MPGPSPIFRAVLSPGVQALIDLSPKGATMRRSPFGSQVMPLGAGWPSNLYAVVALRPAIL